MKKTCRYLLLCASIIVLIFSMTACGKKDKKKETTEKQTTEAVTEEPTTEATTEKMPEVDDEGFTIVNETIKTLDYVNVRPKPSTEGDAVMQLAVDVEVNRIGYNDEWSKVLIDGETYYIFSEYVQVVGENKDDDNQNEKSSEDQEQPVSANGKVICIDPGHQTQPNTDTEPVGPGAEEQKVKVSAGNTGVTTGTEECELNLQIAQKLKSELESRGYTVIMVRKSNDVDISNAARAEIANSEGADAFIRIHANGSSDSSATGVMTVCQTKNNPYNSNIYEQCKSLSAAVLNGMSAATGARSEGVWETDSMSGINWSKVPVTMVEVGYMTNSEEDQLLVTDDYQQKLAEGIANGIDEFLSGNGNE